jgi:hypothetical protein
MPSLKVTLTGCDLGLLRVLADAWGLDPAGLDADQLRASLTDVVLDRENVDEMVSALPENAAAALSDVLRHAGRMPWARLTAIHGEFRQMGEARRGREQPHRNPISATETLIYRGLIARAFLDSETGPREYAYVPDDLLGLIPKIAGQPEAQPGRPAADIEYESVFPAADHVLDRATTSLAAVRSGLDPGQDQLPGRQAFLNTLLRSAGLLDSAGSVEVDQARHFLEATRGQALLDLFSAWRAAYHLDDMTLLPHLEIVAPLKTNPVRTREAVLVHLGDLPSGVWWGVEAFATGIRDREPDFLRPTRSLDSRYVRDRSSGEFLDGSANWDQVEGALIRWLIAGPLHWLGLVDLGFTGELRRRSDAPEKAPRAFRVSPWFDDLLAGRQPAGMDEEQEKLHVRSDGRIGIPRLAPRAARYLVARFCEWEEEVQDEYRYRATPSSLERAG